MAERRYARETCSALSSRFFDLQDGCPPYLGFLKLKFSTAMYFRDNMIMVAQMNGEKNCTKNAQIKPDFSDDSKRFITLT